MREIIATKDAPQAIGPYSQAVKASGLIFTSGQIAIDPATQQVIAGDIAAQTDRVLRNLSEILEAAGSGLGKVVRSTVFLKNMSDFKLVNLKGRRLEIRMNDDVNNTNALANVFMTLADNKVTVISIRSVGMATEQAFLDLVEEEESRGFARAYKTAA